MHSHVTVYQILDTPVRWDILHQHPLLLKHISSLIKDLMNQAGSVKSIQHKPSSKDWRELGAGTHSVITAMSLIHMYGKCFK